MANEFAPTEASNAGRGLQPRPNRLDESMRCNINKGWDGVVNAVLLGAFIVKLLLRNVGLRCANPTTTREFQL